MTDAEREIYDDGYSAGLSDDAVTECPHRPLTNKWQLWQGGYWAAVRVVDQPNEIAFASI